MSNKADGDGKYALLSVFEKEGIVEFARALVDLGWTIIASGGTCRHIREAGVPVQDVADLVGGKAILGHRVVTLSREVHGGLLATSSEADVKELAELKIPRIDLVCVDMYPLEAEIAREGATLESVIEKTDIGGPTMLRAGAKGGRIVICDPADRQAVIDLLKEVGSIDPALTRRMAAKAEFTVAGYVLASAMYLGEGTYAGVVGTRAKTLCYGENRRQANAALFSTKHAKNDPLALDKFKLIEGNDPSFINMTDVHRVLETGCRIGAGWDKNFDHVPHIAVAVKHGNACGAAVGHDMIEVIRKVVAGDPEAISGGVVLLNFGVDRVCAETLRSYLMPDDQPRRIFDAVIAPSFTSEAIEELSRKTGKCRLFTNSNLAFGGLGEESLDLSERFRQVRGGFLKQDGDPFVLELPDEWLEALSPNYQEDLVLGWAIGSTSNSNTITLTKNHMLIGQGVGQRSRVMAAKVALMYVQTYGHSANAAVAYSDSFFPFADGPIVLADAGVGVIFATSGSIRDAEVIEACQVRGVTLLQLPDAEARGFFGH